MTTDLKTFVLDWTDGLNRHDAEAFADGFTDDGVLVNVGTGQRLEGRPAIAADVRDVLLVMWSELHVETLDVVVGEGVFVKEWVMTGVHTGDVPGLPATGKPFSIRGVGVGRLRDGRIGELTEYWNMAEFLGQVGLMPSG
jgi:steroid delta-isomerase-like uncharacterized protein